MSIKYESSSSQNILNGCFCLELTFKEVAENQLPHQSSLISGSCLKRCQMVALHIVALINISKENIQIHVAALHCSHSRPCRDGQQIHKSTLEHFMFVLLKNFPDTR